MLRSSRWRISSVGCPEASDPKDGEGGEFNVTSPACHFDAEAVVPRPNGSAVAGPARAGRSGGENAPVEVVTEPFVIALEDLCDDPLVAVLRPGPYRQAEQPTDPHQRGDHPGGVGQERIAAVQLVAPDTEARRRRAHEGVAVGQRV